METQQVKEMIRRLTGPNQQHQQQKAKTFENVKPKNRPPHRKKDVSFSQSAHGKGGIT